MHYLCHSKHTEESRMAGVQALQLHSNLKRIPALRKGLVLQITHPSTLTSYPRHIVYHVEILII